MSSDQPAVVVKDLYKSFKLPHEQHSGIKQLIVNFAKQQKGYEVQHVLDDVSFEIKKGEFFGIVGRNGSGKSTLLKLLAGIYAPDKGLVQINGSLTPFIELGVGFNPELTGRENVFLNGALLGFGRKEMEAMYDEIVDFAELERFMDQKLKNYSSGMQVRLAFSIAVRAESDILLIDEVLAVGDEAFQQKCFKYFDKLKQENKTVILVTHDMEAVRKYCGRAVLIREGKIIVDGSAEDVANQYTEDNFRSVDKSKKTLHSIGNKNGVSELYVSPVSKVILKSDEDFIFDIHYRIIDDRPITVAFSVIDLKRTGSVLDKRSKVISKEGSNTFRYILPLNVFNEGDFIVTAVVDESDPHRRIAHSSGDDSCRFSIRDASRKNNSLLHDLGEWVEQK